MGTKKIVQHVEDGQLLNRQITSNNILTQEQVYVTLFPLLRVNMKRKHPITYSRQ